MRNYGDLSIFLRAFVDELSWLLERKKERKDKMEFSTARKVRRTSRVASQYTSEADLFELLWLDLASQFARALLYPSYVQAAILNLLNPYIRSCYRTP